MYFGKNRFLKLLREEDREDKGLDEIEVESLEPGRVEEIVLLKEPSFFLVYFSWFLKNGRERIYFVVNLF